MNYFTGIICLVFFCIKLFLVSCGTEKPPGMKQGIYCECCIATVKEISKKLEKKTSDPWQVKVVEALEDICKASSFKTYEYSPPTTVKGCKFLLENYDEDIENVFIQKDKDPEKKVCYAITKACEGVDRTKKEKEEMDVRVNNEKQEVKKEDDGIQRMNVDINDPNSASRLAEQIKQQIAMQQATGATDSDDDDDGEDEEDVDQVPEEEEDGDEGNERSVKKPKMNKEAERKTERQEKTDDENEKPSINKKTEL